MAFLHSVSVSIAAPHYQHYQHSLPTNPAARAGRLRTVSARNVRGNPCISMVFGRFGGQRRMALNRGEKAHWLPGLDSNQAATPSRWALVDGRLSEVRSKQRSSRKTCPADCCNRPQAQYLGTGSNSSTHSSSRYTTSRGTYVQPYVATNPNSTQRQLQHHRQREPVHRNPRY